MTLSGAYITVIVRHDVLEPVVGDLQQRLAAFKWQQLLRQRRPAPRPKPCA